MFEEKRRQAYILKGVKAKILEERVFFPVPLICICWSMHISFPNIGLSRAPNPRVAQPGHPSLRHSRGFLGSVRF